MIQKGKILAITVLLLVISGELLLLSKQAPTKSLSQDSLQKYAEEVLSNCSKKDYRPACYDEKIPKLMDFISMENAFRVTQLVQQKDSSYNYCHVLGHKLSAREAAKDPSRWMDVITRCPVGVCANGCLHGTLQERFRSEYLTDGQIEEIKPDLSKVCEERNGWKPTGLEQATCYHGLGHLAMYLTNADIKKSLDLCDAISIKKDGRDFGKLCYEGLFMQLFQPLEPEDFALVEGKGPQKESLRSFCEQYKGEEKVEACWSEGWPLYRAEVFTPQGLIEFCSVPPDPENQDMCFNMMFHALGQGKNFNVDEIEGFCKQLPSKRKAQCFADGASSIIQADKSFVNRAVELCFKAEKSGVGDECFANLARFSNYNLPSHSEEFLALCASLPEKWQGKCLR